MSILHYRGCGECNWCCYFPQIPEQDSKENELCKQHQGKCLIYDSRPDGCKNFLCLWRRQEQIPDGFRPDRCGVMFEMPDGCRTYIGHIVPGSKGYKSPDVLMLVQKITAAGDAVIMYNDKTGDRDFYLPQGVSKDDVLKDIDRAIAYARGQNDGSGIHN